METTRHSLNLKWCDKTVSAPRKFIVGDRTIYVHICGFDCEYVQLYDHLLFHKSYKDNYRTFVQVARANILKLHFNTKGSYFNYSYYVDEHKKKTIRVYICE